MGGEILTLGRSELARLLRAILREGDHSYLKAESSASASGIVYRFKFDVYRYPRARWRWTLSCGKMEWRNSPQTSLPVG